VLRQLYKETRHNNSITEEAVFMAISNHVNRSSKPDDNTAMTDEPSNILISDTPMPTPQTEVKDKPAPMAKNYAQREYNHAVLNTPKMKVIGKNPSQRHYIGQMLFHDISFGIGPAGTGKTYLAVACAVHALTQHEIQRIILVRPAVEAGERLGFLPGDIGQKVDPYLRPLYDALYDMLGFDKVAKLIEKNVIEIAPLAYMRGRTLNDAAVILDEAQNHHY
jgi:Phosphate starvation-inducible protein PhoH, predicted ATPase